MKSDICFSVTWGRDRWRCIRNKINRKVTIVEVTASVLSRPGWGVSYTIFVSLCMFEIIQNKSFSKCATQTTPPELRLTFLSSSPNLYPVDERI